MSDSISDAINVENISTYLNRCAAEFLPPTIVLRSVVSRSSKNINYLVDIVDSGKYLLKQEPPRKQRKELEHEWSFYRFLESWQLLSVLSPVLSQCLYFDAHDLVLIYRYLDDYQDLRDFWGDGQFFSTAIASAIGNTIGTLHATTARAIGDSARLRQTHPDIFFDPDFLTGLEMLEPEDIGHIPQDGLKFYELFNRYSSLSDAIAQLTQSYNPCCLTHNDLKFNNLLLAQCWQSFPPAGVSTQTAPSMIRIIDWERWAWGDPAFDLGTLLASYLKLWLNRLFLSPSLDLATALSLAPVSLAALQPSMRALVHHYFKTFPEFLSTRESPLQSILKFTGLALIESIRASIQYYEPFGNRGIAMLQVAKSLLCSPAESVELIFGESEKKLMSWV
jgi:thiamine kinase-like enzyme